MDILPYVFCATVHTHEHTRAQMGSTGKTAQTHISQSNNDDIW